MKICENNNRLVNVKQEGSFYSKCLLIPAAYRTPAAINKAAALYHSCGPGCGYSNDSVKIYPSNCPFNYSFNRTHH